MTPVMPQIGLHMGKKAYAQATITPNSRTGRSLRKFIVNSTEGIILYIFYSLREMVTVLIVPSIRHVFISGKAKMSSCYTGVQDVSLR